MNGCSKQDGMSLIEVVAALAILSVLAVYVTVAVRDTHADVIAEAGVLRGHLRYAQGMAMANNTATWGLVVDSQSYTLYRDGQPSPINLPDEASPTRALAPRVQLVQGVGVVTFNEWGDPGQTITFVLSDGGHQETVQLLGFTGLMP